ncbi:hypothetical protein JV173_02655 [Acholeplasma equirhinis]|uniref:hypothetical protein n=1 Tax=Acholeplasma equirhinis TaxID=555393 RepID=UPI00197A8065|nr:hypothetical protein [Acholeplasma equirhinis]MBN3490409.1 hypothetical protein [Acholeplasma equirhinis]
MNYEIHSFEGVGYKKLFSYSSWRLAILNYTDELLIQNINYVEAHNETDEAFVLLRGNATLYFAEVIDGKVIGFDSVNLEPNKVYNVKKGVFHTHTFSTDCQLLIIEEENTSYENSPRIYLDQEAHGLLEKAYEKAHI